MSTPQVFPRLAFWPALADELCIFFFILEPFFYIGPQPTTFYLTFSSDIPQVLMGPADTLLSVSMLGLAEFLTRHFRNF